MVSGSAASLLLAGRTPRSDARRNALRNRRPARPVVSLRPRLRQRVVPPLIDLYPDIDWQVSWNVAKARERGHRPEFREFLLHRTKELVH